MFLIGTKYLHLKLNLQNEVKKIYILNIKLMHYNLIAF